MNRQLAYLEAENSPSYLMANDPDTSEHQTLEPPATSYMLSHD